MTYEYKCSSDEFFSLCQIKVSSDR
jgi:hypothetical protein